ncbi:MAG: threonine synthase, partial [Bacteroidetes bacterium]
FNYTIDPHGAVGYLALKSYQENHKNTTGIILETAHPSKFKDDMENILGEIIAVPERLARLSDLKKEAHNMSIDYKPFKDFLLKNYK